jgi:micrococcal nuclease
MPLETANAEETIPVVEPMVAPVVEPIVVIPAETIAEPPIGPIMETVETPVTDSTVEPVIGPLAEAIVEPAPEPVTEPAVDPTETPTENPMAEPIDDPVAEPIIEPMAAPIDSPIMEPILEPVAKLVADPIETPIGPPIGSPISSILVINEIMPGTEVNPDKDAWVELYNTTDQEILLDGWSMNGVTSGGTWIDVSDGPGRAIQPKGLFLVSHYTNSKSSAMAVKPHVQKSSLLFPNPMIRVELRDPSGQIVDTAEIEKSGADYRSFERKLPPTDGTMAESWARSTMQTNLKTGLTQTFGTPKAENSLEQPIGEVENLTCAESGDDLILNWKNPTNPNLASLNIYRLNAVGDGWDLIANTPPTENWTIPNASSQTTSFKLTTIDFLGRESPGDDVEWAPKAKILINEILPKPKLREAENEFIELWNHGNAPADLRGWQLDNGNLEDDLSYLLIDEGRDYLIQPNSALVLYSNETLISLGNLGDSVYLFDPEGTEIDHMDLTPVLTGRSWGRRPENIGEWFPLGHPTPGAPNVDINRPPVASIKTQGGTREMTINITGEDSMDPDGDRMDFTWIFEPGSSDNRKNPTAYSFATTGQKTIALTVTDEFGLSSTATYSFDAQMEPGGGRDITNPAPTVLRSFNIGDLVIESVLPNPNGKDAGNEKVTIKSNRKEMVGLQGWKLENMKGKRFDMKPLSIQALGRWTFRPSDIKLTLANKEEKLTLLDPAGNRIDSIEWSKSGDGEILFRPSFLEDGIRAEVTGVVDGDTFRARIEGLPVTLRLLGVDTPETVHPFKAVEKFGKEASDYLKNRLAGKTVSLSFEPKKTDLYGRLLAYVHLDGTHINAELVQKGIGVAYTRFPFKFMEEFKTLEQEAKRNKAGLWADPLIQKWVDESNQSEEKTEEIEKPLVLDEKEPKPKKEKKEKIEKEIEERKPEPIELLCPTQGLQIETVLPNPKKGETIEFIRLINPTDRSICLAGWKLDDKPDGGSKPFEIKEGSIDPGANRTFSKEETKLSLNNTDDCATLINPLNEIVDQICYAKTHPNELFTHAGGDWKPKTKKNVTQKKKMTSNKKKKSKKIAVPKQKATPQSYTDYLSTLVTQSLSGTIRSVDFETKEILFENETQMITVSFANSNVDVASVMQMIDPGSSVTLDLRGSELVAIKPLQIEPGKPEKRENQQVEWELSLAILGLASAGLVVRARSKRVDLRKKR